MSVIRCLCNVRLNYPPRKSSSTGSDGGRLLKSRADIFDEKLISDAEANAWAKEERRRTLLGKNTTTKRKAECIVNPLPAKCRLTQKRGADSQVPTHTLRLRPDKNNNFPYSGFDCRCR
ncbi:hypothetical cytosolic protein [Syntrophus aciditrophicus SB]|uniref:Hypothetical cytosolic protein n=1 Tax=Syntrophus aciditrophicus (strain SB) TaxID=56780 RepID=Q2LS44_SYNAS|nr:hypothetical cytosolic protein [Syntrophus aciditrophicus SB]